MRTFVLFLAVGLLTAQTAAAGDACSAPACCEQARANCDPGCCPRCGAKMVCKLVCETREIKKTVWQVKCENFCAPLPRLARGCCACGDPGCDGGCGKAACGEAGCGNCGNGCDPCAVEEAKCHVPPKCGPVRCKKTLVKKEVVCKVPSYKCVPVCCHCCGDPGCCEPGCGGTAAPAEKVPPAPAPAPAAEKTTRSAPLPAVVGTSYWKK